MKREEIIARVNRAEEALASGRYSVERLGRSEFAVTNGDGQTYTVSFADVETGTCSCPDFRQRGTACKHLAMVVKSTWPAQMGRWVEKVLALAEDAPTPVVAAPETDTTNPIQTNSTQEETMNAIADIIRRLSEPFSPSDVMWKPGAISKDRTRAMAVAYVDSREYMNRLDQADPGWSDEYQVIPLPDRVLVICRLTIGGITRTGDGECLLADTRGETEENALTSASAQAFKRACAKFGLGRYLYDLPRVWVDYDGNGFTAEAQEYLRRIAAGENPPSQPRPHERENARQNGQNGNGQPQPSKGKSGQPITVKFGKYAGKTLEQVAAEDPDYLEWLAREWQWEEGRKAAQALLARQKEG
jgi:predicted nucleic acid-binding Zn finger protein